MLIRSLCFCQLILTGAVLAQVPVINSVSDSVAYPGEKILISGSGFNTNPALLQVWFGQVMAPVISSSNFSIEVTVPPQARSANIEVVNLSSKLSGKSDFIFSPYFSGDQFNETTIDAPYTTASVSELYDLCSCDLDGDGKPEISSTKISNKTEILVLKNQSSVGVMTFTPQSFTTNPFFTDKITCGDLNGDGKPELVASRGGLGGNRNSLLILTNISSGGTIDFGARIPLTLPDNLDIARYVVIRDLNSDGKPDLIVSNSNDNDTFYIFQNQSAGGAISFTPTPISISLPGLTGLTSFGLDVQDFDGDGKPDIAVSEWQSNKIFIYRNTSSGAITFDLPLVEEIPNASLLKLIAADLNNDGKIDVASTDFFRNKLLIILNNSSPGTLDFGQPISFDTGANPEGLDYGDIDGDQDIDLVVASRGQAQLNVMVNNGNSVPAFSKIIITNSKNVRNVSLGDLDGDAKPDLAFTSFNSGSFQYSLDILRNKACFVPEIINQLPLENCAGQNVKIESIPGYAVTFDWEFNSTVFQSGVNSFVDVTAAGDYSATATSESGNCIKSSSLITLVTNTGTVPADPVINDNSPVCAGQTIELSTTSVLGATYVWTGPDGFSSGNLNPIVPSASGNNAGSYSLQIALGPCKSNLVTNVIEIADLNGLSVTSTSSTNAVCNGTALQLSVPFNTGYTYQWKKDAQVMIGEIGSTISATSSGNYSVLVAFPDAGSCNKTTDPVLVSVLDKPVAGFNVNNACLDQDFQFQNTSVLDPDGQSLASFSWTFGALGTSTDANPVFKFAEQQNYAITLLAGYRGVEGCSDTKTEFLDVVLPDVPNILATLSEICPGEISTLTVSGGNFINFDWSNGSSDSSLEITQPGDYVVHTKDVNGCDSAATISILSKVVPVITVTADRANISKGEQTHLSAQGADTYSWEPVVFLDNPFNQNPVAFPDVTTTFFVTGTLTGQCSARDSIEIIVSGDANFPNVFTPNGDGDNDLWIIPNIASYSDCTLSIFDGAGGRVIEQKGYSNDWDGTYRGKRAPEGVYFYVMGCPNRPPITGHVLIHR